MKINYNEISLEVIPNESHEWLLDTASVAEGYGVTPDALTKQANRRKDELEEGRHYLNGQIVLAGQNRTVRMWTKKGVIALGFFVRSGKAKQFRRWAEDLIIAAAKASPIDNLKNLEPHTKRETQIENSKLVNAFLFKNWDRETLIDYNRRHCRMVSGYSPAELIAIAKKRGLKSKQYASGKEVLRHLKPGWAAQMSINDDLVQKGLKLTEANALSAPCVPLLEKMIELKMITA